MADACTFSSKRNRLHESGWCCGMTIEPVYALFSFVEVMSKFFYQNLLLQKVCRLDRTHEPDLNTTCDDREAGLRFVATANSWFLSPAMLVSTVVTMLAISWSDKAGHRRRPLIFVPLVGMLLEGTSAMLQSYFWHWSAFSAVIPYVLFQLLFGGRVCFTQSAYLYLTDITNEQNRAARLSSMVAIRYFCLPLGSGISGFLLHRVGFYYSFGICNVLTVVALVLSVVLVRDVVVPTKNNLKFLDMINPKNIIDSFKVILKRRPDNATTILVLLLVTYSLHSFTFDGEMSVSYLYFVQEFQWNEENYSMFVAFKLFAICFGTIVVSVVLIKWLKVRDGVILIFISVTKTAAAICYMLARHDWEVYSVGVTLSRSFATKLVVKNEYGHLAAVMSLSKMSYPLSQLLYNAVFSVTMKTFAGSFFLISGILSGVMLILSYLSHRMYEKRSRVYPDDVLIQ